MYVLYKNHAKTFKATCYPSGFSWFNVDDWKQRRSMLWNILISLWYRGKVRCRFVLISVQWHFPGAAHLCLSVVGWNEPVQLTLWNEDEDAVAKTRLFSASHSARWSLSGPLAPPSSSLFSRLVTHKNKMCDCSKKNIYNLQSFPSAPSLSQTLFTTVSVVFTRMNRSPSHVYVTDKYLYLRDWDLSWITTAIIYVWGLSVTVSHDAMRGHQISLFWSWSWWLEGEGHIIKSRVRQPGIFTAC